MSLHGDYDPDNIFAKILRGEIPSVKVELHDGQALGLKGLLDGLPSA